MMIKNKTILVATYMTAMMTAMFGIILMAIVG